MNRRKNKVLLKLMMWLLDKYFDDLSVKEQQELVNITAARAKQKELAVKHYRSRMARKHSRRVKEADKLAAEAEEDAKKGLLDYLNGNFKEEAG